MKKRLISLLLSVAVLTTSIPVSTFADNPVGQESAATSEENEERGIDYKKNGGTFREGYEAPSEYPGDRVCREQKTLQNRDMNLVDGMIIRN